MMPVSSRAPPPAITSVPLGGPYSGGSSAAVRAATVVARRAKAPSARAIRRCVIEVALLTGEEAGASPPVESGPQPDCLGLSPRGRMRGYWAASSAGRAPRSQRGGREFEPPAVHHRKSHRKARLPPGLSYVRSCAFGHCDQIVTTRADSSASIFAGVAGCVYRSSIRTDECPEIAITVKTSAPSAIIQRERRVSERVDRDVTEANPRPLIGPPNNVGHTIHRVRLAGPEVREDVELLSSPILAGVRATERGPD